MKITTVLALIALFAAPCVARDFDLSPLTNEISLYKNADDSLDDLGETLQLISINSIKALTWFNLEFTGDLNWNMSEGEDFDYYIEIGLVKQLTGKLSVNYQRIHGTFVPKPINQVGLRLSL
jgi:hypothetical protein